MSDPTDETCPPKLADNIAHAFLGELFLEQDAAMADWNQRADELEAKLRARLAKLEAIR